MRLFFTIIMTMFLLPICIPAFAETQIVFRYDDLAADRDGDRDKYILRKKLWQGEQDFDKIFKKYNMPYVIAVIPKFNTSQSIESDFKKDKIVLTEDPVKINFLKKGIKEGRIEVAQHGYDHINKYKKGYLASEYYGRDYESQLKDIRNGKKILVNALGLASIDTFIPPFFTWDHNTAKALKKCGFTILSTDKYRTFDEAKGLTVIPYTALLSELEEMVLTNSLPDNRTIIAIYHPAEIIKIPGTESLYFGKDRLERLVSKLSKIDHAKVLTFKDLVKKNKNLTFQRYKYTTILSQYSDFLRKFLPKRFLPGEELHTIYLTEQEYKNKVIFWGIILFAILLLVVVSSSVTSLIMKRNFSKKLYNIFIGLSMLGSILSIAMIFSILNRGYYITGIRALPLFVFLGFLLIPVSIYLKRKIFFQVK